MADRSRRQPMVAVRVYGLAAGDWTATCHVCQTEIACGPYPAVARVRAAHLARHDPAVEVRWKLAVWGVYDPVEMAADLHRLTDLPAG